MMGEKAKYLISGLASMAVSWACMWLADTLLFGGSAHPGPYGNAVLGLANWASGMLAAYALNRAWVFRSRNPVWPEFRKFLASRIGTLCLDQLLRQLLGVLGAGLWLSTMIVLAVVTVLNYVLGKRQVFRTQDATKM